MIGSHANVGKTARTFGIAGGVTGYRDRTYTLIRSVLRDIGHIDDAIDVGAGDGWAAQTLMDEGLVGRCQPVDVVRRKLIQLEPVLYDGSTLPFDDKGVTLAYAIDAAHHASNPLRFIQELGRVARRFVLLKDHTYASVSGRVALRILDEIGNRRFSIGSPGNYQRDFRWFRALEDDGFLLRKLIHPARCHVGWLGTLTNKLQFVALFERAR